MEQNKLIGLVLAGGFSTRMHQDKSLLCYHGKPQYQYVYELLQTVCAEVYISCRKNQIGQFEPRYKVLPDIDEDIGPITSLSTAFKHFPKASFVLLGCDYPFFDKTALLQLIEARNSKADAITFINPHTQIPEALLGIYESGCSETLKKEILAGNHSLRYFLQKITSHLIVPQSILAITSIDTPEAMEDAIKKLST